MGSRVGDSGPDSSSDGRSPFVAMVSVRGRRRKYSGKSYTTSLRVDLFIEATTQMGAHCVFSFLNSV